MTEQPVFMRVLIRKGNFNFLDPKEKTTNCHFSLLGTKHNEAANITLPKESYEYIRDMKDTPLEVLKEVLAESSRHYIFSSSAKQGEKLLKLALPYEMEIERAYYQQQLDLLKQKKTNLDEKIKVLERLLEEK